MLFWKRKPKSQPEPKYHQNPFILFELVDGIHLEITISWPPKGDVKPFAQLLTLLNSGGLIGPQLTEAVLFANSVNEPEKAVIIQAALDSVATNKKKGPSNPNKPIVPPSKAFSTQMKYHTH